MAEFCVIFDMDGTLVDSQRLYVPAWEFAGKEQGFEGFGKLLPEVCGMNAQGWQKFLRNRFPSLDVEKFVGTMIGYIKQHYEVCFMSGAKKTLEFLHEKGVRMAVASGSDTCDVERCMQQLGVADYFVTFVGGEQVKNGKPAPDIFLKAAEKLGAKPENCFVVEDSSNGIRAGYAAGMRCIGIPDLIDFSAEIKTMLFAQFSDLSQTISLFEKELKR